MMKQLLSSVKMYGSILGKMKENSTEGSNNTATQSLSENEHTREHLRSWLMMIKLLMRSLMIKLLDLAVCMMSARLTNQSVYVLSGCN